MNVEEFRKYGKEVIDYICEYSSNIEEREVAPTLNPGYLKKLLPGKQSCINIFYILYCIRLKYICIFSEWCKFIQK